MDSENLTLMRRTFLALLLVLTALPALAQVTITNVFVSASTATTATIQWTTSGPSTSQVLYGFDSSIPFGSPVNPAMVTSHSVTLTVLDPSRFYFFAVSSIDGAGHVTQSATENFGLCGGNSQPFNPATGTINNYYEYGSFTLTWNPPSGSSATPTVCGQPISTTITGVLSGGASMSASVADSYKVIPGPGSWHVAATDAGNLAPISFDYPLSAQNTDVSQQLAAVASTAGLVDVLANTIAHTVFPSWICTTFNNLCATSGGGVTQIIPGTNVTCAPNVGGNCVGAVTINSSGGGGGTIPGTAGQAIYSDGAGSALASKATFDAAGNSKTLSNDGTFNAYLSQSAPGANDGIRLALQTVGNFVVAGNDYPCVEGTYTGSEPPFVINLANYRLGIGTPAPFANATELFDMRGACGAQGTYSYNPYYSATPGTWKFDRIVENHLPQTTTGGVTNFFWRTGVEYTGSGINSGFTSVGPDSEGLVFDTAEIMTRGIQSRYNLEEQVLGQGDNHLFQFQITNDRGSPDVNGEGFNSFRIEVLQNLTPMAMTSNSTLAAGATLIQGTLNSVVPFPGDGTYLIDSTRGGPIMQIIGEAPPGSIGTCGRAGQWLVNAILTPDNIGCVSAGQPSIPIQRYGATTNATVTVTGLTSALSTGSTACVADHLFQESATVENAGSFSGGTATGVVLALRYPHQPNFYVTQGPHACNAMEIKANQVPGSFVGRQLFRIIGAPDSTHYLYSRTTFGGWDSGLSGYAKTYDVANAGTTLTRNGSGIVTVPVSDSGGFLNLVDAIVTGCIDSSFNGIFVVTSDTGSAVTWANPGAAGTTTCSKDIEVLSKLNNTQGIRDAQEFPAAEIVNTVDPVTFANNYNLSVEPNTNMHAIAGDQLENHPYADIIQGFDRNLMNFQSQTTPSVAQLMHFDQISGFTPEGISWYRIAFTDSPSGYQGLSGSKIIGANLIDMSDTTTPFASLFLNLPVPTDVVFQFNGCVFGCSDSRSHTTFFSFAMNNGSYFQTVNQSTDSINTLLENVALNQLYNKFETDQGFSYFTSNGLTGPSNMENLFEWTGGSTKITTSSNSGSTQNVFLMIPTGTSFSQPITVPSCIGCGGGISGSVTTTAAATDVVTITGMTASGHCAAPGPTNAAAGTMIQNATPVFIDTFTTNAITLHHVATAGATFSFVCSPN